MNGEAEAEIEAETEAEAAADAEAEAGAETEAGTDAEAEAEAETETEAGTDYLIGTGFRARSPGPSRGGGSVAEERGLLEAKAIEDLVDALAGEHADARAELRLLDARHLRHHHAAARQVALFVLEQDVAGLAGAMQVRGERTHHTVGSREWLSTSSCTTT